MASENVRFEKQVANLLYKKLAGVSFDSPTLDRRLGLIRLQKRHILAAIRDGRLGGLLDLLIIDPALLGRLGTKRYRDRLKNLAEVLGLPRKNGA